MSESYSLLKNHSIAGVLIPPHMHIWLLSIFSEYGIVSIIFQLSHSWTLLFFQLFCERLFDWPPAPLSSRTADQKYKKNCINAKYCLKDNSKSILSFCLYSISVRQSSSKEKHLKQNRNFLAFLFALSQIIFPFKDIFFSYFQVICR